MIMFIQVKREMINMSQHVLEEPIEKIVGKYTKPHTHKLKPKCAYPKCAYPKCNKKAATKIHGIFLCQVHADWGEFIKWLYYKLGLS